MISQDGLLMNSIWHDLWKPWFNFPPFQRKSSRVCIQV